MVVSLAVRLWSRQKRHCSKRAETVQFAYYQRSSDFGGILALNASSKSAVISESIGIPLHLSLPSFGAGR
jgi:hypothetical protein